VKAVFTLKSAESRRLIAKAVAAMEEVKQAKEKAYIILAGGTTNGFVAQEILGDMEIKPYLATVGTSTDGVLCVTKPDSRKPFPGVLYKGEPVDKSISDAFQDFHLETVVIKGANAVDPEGNVGVITAGFDGGTVPKIIGTVTSQGLTYITPVGLEKLVPSVKEAAKAVVPNTLLRFESLMQANNCANAPKNMAQGIKYDTPVVSSSFWVDATRVTIASPNNPNADGSALTIFIFCV